MTMYTRGKVQAQERPKETLRLYLRLILGTETAHNRLQLVAVVLAIVTDLCSTSCLSAYCKQNTSPVSGCQANLT